MDYALVKAGVVVNLIVADAEFIAEHGAELADACVDVTDVLVKGTQPGIGWSYDGMSFAPPAGA